MCDECGCRTIEIEKSVNHANDKLAGEIANTLKAQGVLCINIMGSPGSGKTTFIEGVAGHLGTDDMFVIEGDLESDVDKVRLGSKGIASYQINTHSGCHLNADMIMNALKNISLEGKKYLLIENVGNLVCPAGMRIGQHLNILISSTTEGSDKPRKYPHIFRDAQAIILSKTDMAQAAGFAEGDYVRDIRMITQARILRTSREAWTYEEPSHLIEHEREHLLGHHHH